MEISISSVSYVGMLEGLCGELISNLHGQTHCTTRKASGFAHTANHLVSERGKLTY